MNLIDRLIIKEFHKDRLRNSGGDRARAQGWSDLTSQQKRFDILTGLVDLTGRTVLDVGCGTGDLRQKIDESYANVHYVGIDHDEEFIRMAGERYGERNDTQFIVADIAACQLPAADVILASGVLNYKSSDPDYYQNMIRRLYNAANHAIAFNMLDSSQVQPGSLLVAHNPPEIRAFCESICEDVQLVENYLPDDFTICMKRT